MALSTINEVVDRSIEEVIYQTTLTEGYTPNRDTYQNDVPGYNSAIDAIIAANGFAVDVFGHSSSDNKDQLKSPRIIYTNIAFQPGFLGGGNELLYEDNGSDFTASRRGPRTGQLRFSITLVSESAAQDRILHAILARSLKNQSYIPFYNDSTKSFLVTYLYNRYDPDEKEGLIRKVYLYEAHDLWEDEFEVVNPNMAKMTDIQVSEDQSTEQKAEDTEIIQVTTP